MTELTEANRKVAADALAAIEAEEDAFDMSAWILHTPLKGWLNADESPSACGTTLCLAGWVAHNAGWRIGWGGAAVKDGEVRHVEAIALDELGIRDEPLAAWICYASNETAKNALRALAAGEIPDFHAVRAGRDDMADDVMNCEDEDND
jgi:hypothetical protein